jgi:hypothetical protein
VVPALNLELDLDALPVEHTWGDTDESERPHVWGTPGSMTENGSGGGNRGASASVSSKGKGKGRKGKSTQLREQAYERGYKRDVRRQVNFG